MLSPNKRESPSRDGGNPPNSNYGEYAYSQGYGYGYGGGGAQRGFGDYFLVIRERFWTIFLVFLVIFSLVLVFTLTRIPAFQASARVQVFHRDPVAQQVQAQGSDAGEATAIGSVEDLNTQVQILESESIAMRVAEDLKDEDLRNFLAPYQRKGRPSPSAFAIIFANRKIVLQRLSLIIEVRYSHPDRIIAAKIANLLVDEYISYNQRLRVDEAMKAVENLKVQADIQEKRVKDLANSLLAYRQKNNMVSLDERKDIVTDKLKTLNNYVTETSAKLQNAEVLWKQVQERSDDPTRLLDLDFIASQPLIGRLQQEIASRKIAVAELSQHYRDKYPNMIEARQSLEETQSELKRALVGALVQIQDKYQTAKRDFDAAHMALASQEAQSLELDSYGVAYSNLERDYHINEQLLEGILARMRESAVTSDVQTEGAHIVDQAMPPAKPFSPKVLLNLSLGAVGGLGLGLAAGFFIAFVDDRVKTTYDIESVVGLPVIGILPLIKERLKSEERATIAATNASAQTAEAFRTIHAALRLKEESKNAKCIAITSTIPGEGKSFITTNMALTFAAHGERVVIVDCDLRRPNIHKLLNLENVKGTIDLASGTTTLEEATQKGFYPNLDVIVTGGRAKNPTQLLNSKNFETMIGELRKRYDRVFVDTPPMGAVSDALIILPLLDGLLFTIFFNRVRRKTAQHNVQRLGANIPCFGAVLNGLDLNIAHYYYKQYYDRSYQDYYANPDKDSTAR